MAERRFRLAIGLQLPPGTKGPYLPEGEEVDESKLAGLNVDALVQSKWLVEIPVKGHCPACAVDNAASAAARKKTYDALELQEHYAKQHPALAAPE